MSDWIDSLIGLLSGGVRSIANGVVDRLHTLWGTITGLGGRVYGGWGRLLARARAWSTAQVRHALAVVGYLKWLTLVVIPHAMEVGIDAAIRWARDQIAREIAAVRATIDAGVRALRSELAAARAGLRALADWAVAQLAALAARAVRLEQRVFGVLATPERVVAWILAPLVTALVRFVLNNAGRLGQAAWRARRNGEGLALDVVEEIITRIM